MQSSQDYQRLVQACTQEGCLLCRLSHESTERYLETWKYDLFTDVGLREELRHSQGFCNLHTWQLAQLGACLQLAQAYRDIITDTIEELQQPALLQRSRWLKARRDIQPCPACTYQDKAVARLISTLRQAIQEPSFYAAYVASSGLCLPHFRLSCELRQAESPRNWLDLLRQAQLSILQKLDEQLGEMIRKHDYRFRDEERGAEMLSWKRAADIVAGSDIHQSQKL